MWCEQVDERAQGLEDIPMEKVVFRHKVKPYHPFQDSGRTPKKHSHNRADKSSDRHGNMRSNVQGFCMWKRPRLLITRNISRNGVRQDLRNPVPTQRLAQGCVKVCSSLMAFIKPYFLLDANLSHVYNKPTRRFKISRAAMNCQVPVNAWTFNSCMKYFRTRTVRLGGLEASFALPGDQWTSPSRPSRRRSQTWPTCNAETVTLSHSVIMVWSLLKLCLYPMIPTKRKKRSGPSGLELQKTIRAMQNLITSLQAQDVDDDDDDKGEYDMGPEVSQLKGVVAKLQTKLEGPQVIYIKSLITLTVNCLSNLDLTPSLEWPLNTWKPSVSPWLGNWSWNPILNHEHLE